jgi:hypothetical protein
VLWLVILGIGGRGAFDGLGMTLTTLTITAFAVWSAGLGISILSGRYERGLQHRLATMPTRLGFITCFAAVTTAMLGLSAIAVSGPTVAGLIIVLGGIGTVGFARAWWQLRRDLDRG